MCVFKFVGVFADGFVECGCLSLVRRVVEGVPEVGDAEYHGGVGEGGGQSLGVVQVGMNNFFNSTREKRLAGWRRRVSRETADAIGAAEIGVGEEGMGY